MSKIRVVSQKPVFKAKLFEVFETKLVAGKKHTYHEVRKDPVVSVFPINEKGEIYLLSQYRYFFKDYILEEVAGYIDKGEKPLAAAKRELQEEAGIKASKWTQLGSADLAASVIKGEYYLFLAQDLKLGIAKPEDDEDLSLISMPIEEAVRLVLSGKIRTAISMLGILLLDKLKQEGKL